MLRQLPALEPFQYLDFYDTEVDKLQSSSGADYVKLTNNGIDLVADYYADKYQMERIRRFPNIDTLVSHVSSNFVNYQGQDTRVPFVFNSMINVRTTGRASTHSSPAVFVQEGGKKAILYFDSLGDVSAAKELAEKTGLTVYTIPIPRQLDYYSCHTDALVFLRELAGKRNGNWLMPNIISWMEGNIVNPGNPAEVNLPPNLAITAQLPYGSVKGYQQDTTTKVHHGKHGSETYPQFVARNPEAETFEKTKPISGYLRKKGFGMANIIEIQSYVKQLQKRLGADFTDTIRKEFIKNAKIELESQGPLTASNLKTRKGLREFTEKFVDQHFNIEWEQTQSSAKTSDFTSGPKSPFENSSNFNYSGSKKPEQESFYQPQPTKESDGDFYRRLMQKYAEEDKKTESKVDQPKMSYQSLVKKHEEEDKAMSMLKANENTKAKTTPFVAEPTTITKPKSSPISITQPKAQNHSQLYPSLNSDNFVKIRTQKFVDLISAVNAKFGSRKAVKALNVILKLAQDEFAETYKDSKGNVTGRKIDEIETKYLQQMNDVLKDQPKLYQAFHVQLSNTPRNRK